MRPRKVAVIANLPPHLEPHDDKALQVDGQEETEEEKELPRAVRARAADKKN